MWSLTRRFLKTLKSLFDWFPLPWLLSIMLPWLLLYHDSYIHDEYNIDQTRSVLLLDLYSTTLLRIQDTLFDSIAI